MKLTVEVKNVYGHRIYYPKCDKSQLLCQLLRQISFSNENVEILKKLGYEFESKKEEI